MKSLSLSAIIILLISVASSYASVGSALRDAKIPNLVERAVPNFKFEKGDKDWSGGMYSSAYTNTTSFDSNVIYSIYTSSKKLSASDAASAILHLIAKEFSLPVDSPSSTWSKKTPTGLLKEDYAMVFLNGHSSNEKYKGVNYITVEVVKLDDSHYSVSVVYVWTRNQ